jgi:3-deoxy-7-phosphoheptulonate synthase
MTSKQRSKRCGRALLVRGGVIAPKLLRQQLQIQFVTASTDLQMAAVLHISQACCNQGWPNGAKRMQRLRSNDLETRGDVTLPAYRGDAVNDIEFTAEARYPDPNRLVITCPNPLLRLLIWFVHLLRNFQIFVRYTNELKALFAIHNLVKSTSRWLMKSGAPSHLCNQRVWILSNLRRLISTQVTKRSSLNTKRHLLVSIRALNFLTMFQGRFIWIGERTRQLDETLITSKVRNPNRYQIQGLSPLLTMRWH